MTYNDGTAYTNDIWTNRAVYMYGGISGSTDTGGILKYQISADNVNWVDYVYDYTNQMYGITTQGINYRYARAVDKSLNVSNSISRIIKIDTVAPTVPTFIGMTYNDGTTNYVNDTWATQAVYMYGGISGSTDTSGILKYQISADNVNWVDYAYDYTNQLYGLTTQGINYRYARAVDYAGNISSSFGRTIRIDSVAPVHTNWWWGAVTSSGASLYIQANDATSGINRVQCPTSTEAAGYADWYWYNSAWDTSANAYRCDIQRSTFGHSGTYVTHLYIYDNAGLGGYYNATSIAVPNPQVTLNINSYQEITDNFNFLPRLQYPDTPATVTYDNGTALFQTPVLDNWYSLQFKPVSNGINNVQFSLGSWISDRNFVTNNFYITLSDGTTIYFYYEHYTSYSEYYQYLPAPSLSGYFAVKNNINGSATNIGAQSPDGYNTYSIAVDGSGNLTMTSSAGNTYTTNIGSRKIVSVTFSPIEQWWNNATIGRLDYLKYTIN
jgi:hypothetical protein